MPGSARLTVPALDNHRITFFTFEDTAVPVRVPGDPGDSVVVP